LVSSKAHAPPIVITTIITTDISSVAEIGAASRAARPKAFRYAILSSL
jgi:hypothetical protein